MSDMSPALGDAPVMYQVRPLSPGARLLEVLCKVREPDPSAQLLSLPAWIPGSYLIRNFARHVVSIEASCNGEPVAVRKIDKSSWQCGSAAGSLLIRIEVYASDPSVRGANLDGGGCFFNGTSLLLRVHGKEAERHVLHLSPGEDPGSGTWRVATTLGRLTGEQWEYGAFEAPDYETLIDHPVLMGPLTVAEFSAGGVPHALVIAGRHDADLPRLQADLATLCNWQIGFFGQDPPMSRYLFLLRLTGEGMGGLEHRSSSALVCHRNHLPHSAQPPGRDYQRFLGLASHEYFHLWMVKRVRPAEFAPYRLDRENYTRQLWIFEGITSYYDDMALLRCGLIPLDAYLELLGRTLTAVYRTGGRRRQTLEEASFDAWIKYYQPDENSPNAEVSYYAKGAMVALALDLELRLRSEGRASLDEVIRVLWETHGRNSRHGLADGAFEELAAEATGVDLAEFFRVALRATSDPPLGILLAQFGLRLNFRPAESAADQGGTAGRQPGRSRAWLGVRTRSLNGRVAVSHVLDEGPGQSAGIAAGDEIVALDGIRVEGAALEAALDRLTIGQSVELTLFRRDELMRFSLVVAEAPKDTCYIALDPEAGPEAIARRRAWLQTPGG